MKKQHEPNKKRGVLKSLSSLQKENSQLRLLIDELEQELVIYRAREVADYMQSLGYNNTEAQAALSILKSHINKK